MVKTLARPVRNATFLAVLFCLGWFGGAKAQSIVYTDTEPIVFANTPYTLTFNQFNPTLGVLTSAQISLTGGVSGTLQYENRNPAPVVLTINVTATLGITAPNQSSLSAGGPAPIFTVSDSLPKFDGIVDYGGPPGLASGRTRPFTTTVSNAHTYSTTADLQPFIGAGQINLPLHLQGGFTAGGATSNVAIVVSTDAKAVGVVIYRYLSPSIALKKLTNGFDANSPNGADVPQIQPGAPVTWTYILTNTGAVTLPLASVVMTDSQPGITPTRLASSDVGGDDLLSPGEVWRYQAIGVAQALTAPSSGVTVVSGCNPNPQGPGLSPAYENIGRVSVPGATASDPSHYCNLSNEGQSTVGIHLEKTVYSGHNQGSACPGSKLITVAQGDPITYCFVVTNTGQTYLSNIVITDTILGINVSNMSLLSGTMPLAPGAKLTYFYETTMTESLVNTAVVKGTPTDSIGTTIPLPPPTDQNTATVQVPPTALDLVYANVARTNTGVTLTWAELPERKSIGFNLYRSTTNQRSDAGLVSTQMVVGHSQNQGEFGTVIAYTFNDTTATDEATYFYWLAGVKADGSTVETDPLIAHARASGQQIFLPQVSR